MWPPSNLVWPEIGYSYFPTLSSKAGWLKKRGVDYISCTVFCPYRLLLTSRVFVSRTKASPSDFSRFNVEKLFTLTGLKQRHGARQTGCYPASKAVQARARSLATGCLERQLTTNYEERCCLSHRLCCESRLRYEIDAVIEELRCARVAYTRRKDGKSTTWDCPDAGVCLRGELFVVISTLHPAGSL